MDLGLAAQRVLITGALGDFGRAFVHAFRAEGAAVIATGREPPAEAHIRWPELNGCDYFQLRMDQPAEIREVVAASRPDIVIGNAAVTQPASLLEASLDGWNKLLTVNLTGNMVLGQAAARHFLQIGRGAMVFVSSVVAQTPWPKLGAYPASKAGLEMYARNLALEVAGAGIRVNCVAPGVIDAGMARKQMDRDPRRQERALAQIPCGRFGTVEEVAEAVVWIASPRAAYITGERLLVDGGAALGKPLSTPTHATAS